jgi:hypothetical protein
VYSRLRVGAGSWEAGSKRLRGAAAPLSALSHDNRIRSIEYVTMEKASPDHEAPSFARTTAQFTLGSDLVSLSVFAWAVAF